MSCSAGHGGTKKWARIGVLVVTFRALILFNLDSVGFQLPSLPSSYEYATASSSDAIWPEIKQVLCPAMVPRVECGDTLFSLARCEIGLKEWHGSNQERFSRQFFKESKRGFVYKSPSNETTIYTAIWKAANNQIMGWAHGTLGNRTDGSSYDEPKGRELPIVIARQVESQDQPCIVTAIRDPVSHFLSGYNEIEYRLLTGQTKMPDSRVQPFSRFKEGTPQRFEQFVVDLLGGPMLEGWSNWNKIQPAHVYSMSNVLSMLASQGTHLTSYLPSLDDLVKTWPKFLRETCPGIPDMRPMDTLGQHNSSGDPYGTYTAAKLVFAQGGVTARALCVLHAMDYACWENLPDGIPLLCQDVYASRSFVDGIRKHGN